MKVPQAMLDRLEFLKRNLGEAEEDEREAAVIRHRCAIAVEECEFAIKMVREAPDPDFAEVESERIAMGPPPPRERRTRAEVPRRERRTREAMRADVEEAIAAAGAEGLTAKEVAKSVRLQAKVVDEIIADLLQAGKCDVEGDRIMAQQENNTSLFPPAAN